MTRDDLERDATQPGSWVQELVDRNAITDLVGRLGLWLDEKRFDEAQSIFTEDATADTPGGSVQGVDLLVEQASRGHEDRTQHVITNVLIDLAGDRATVRANMIATMIPDADAPEPLFVIGGRYRFEAVRTPEGWRFSRLEVNPVWRSGS